MRLLIVGSDKIYAIENFYVKYLREAEINVSHFSAQSLFYDYYQKSILNKLIFKSGMSNILERINEQFKLAVSAYKPDIIWVFKGMEIFPQSLKWAKDKNIKLVNYNPDNPFLFSGKGSGNDNLKNAIALYDLHLTYNLEVKEKMEAGYKIPTQILPFGFDVSDDLFEACCAVGEVNRACFLGNPDSFRGKFLQQLAEAGIKIDVYGNNWKKFVQHENVNVFMPVYGDELWMVLRKYRVQINLMRPHNPDSHNMRSFEVPGIGGIQLAPDTPDHRKYFDPGTEIFLYSNVAECARQILFLQSLSITEANKIRIQARRRCLQSGYSYKERSKQALSFIEKLWH